MGVGTGDYWGVARALYRTTKNKKQKWGSEEDSVRGKVYEKSPLEAPSTPSLFMQIVKPIPPYDTCHPFNDRTCIRVSETTRYRSVPKKTAMRSILFLRITLH